MIQIHIIMVPEFPLQESPSSAIKGEEALQEDGAVKSEPAP